MEMIFNSKMPKQTKVITKRRKFIEVEIPMTRSKIELIGTTPEEIKNKTIKLDLTRQLKGKSVEATVKINIENNKPIANPIKIKLMPYFIRRMIRKRISYIEDSFETPSQESILKIKPFIITRKRVSRAVRKTIRNKAKNWLEDYIAEKKDNEIFNEILSNRLQKPLSLMLKKTYPLSLCEIRTLEIKRPLKPEEIPKIKPKKESEEQLSEPEEKETKKSPKIEQGLDQLKEIEDEKIKQAQQEIQQTQEKAVKLQDIEKQETKEIKDEIKKEIKKSKKQAEEKQPKTKSTKKENIKKLSEIKKTKEEKA